MSKRTLGQSMDATPSIDSISTTISSSGATAEAMVSVSGVTTTGWSVYVFSGLPSTGTQIGTQIVDPTRPKTMTTFPLASCSASSGVYAALGQNGAPYSAIEEVVWQVVPPTSIRIGDDAVDVTWNPVDLAFPNVVVTLLDSAMRKICSGAFPNGGTGRLALTALLRSGDTYSLSLLGVVDDATGPASTTSLSLATPTLTGLIYVAGDSPQLTVAYADAPAGSTVGLRLFAEDRLVMDVAPASPSSPFPVSLPHPLAPWSRWTAAIYAVTGVVDGPSGTPAAIPLSAPALTSAAAESNGGQMSVDFEWTFPPGAAMATGAFVDVRTSDGKTSIGSATANGVSAIVATSAPIAGAAYVVRASSAIGAAVGATSADVPIVTDAPTVAATAYDGATLTITVAGAPNNAAASRAVVSDSSGNPIATGDGGLTTIVLPLALDAAETYTVAVCGLGGLARGPSSAPVAILAGAPALTAAVVSVDGGDVPSLSLTWTRPLTLAAATSYVAVVSVPGADLVQPIAGDVTTASFALGALTDFVARSAGAFVTLRAIDGPTTGPSSAPTPLVADAPDDLRVVFDGTDALVSWAPPIDPRVNGFLVSMTVGAAAPTIKRVSSTRTSLTVPPSSDAVTLAVASAIGVATGLSSSPVTILTAAPALSLVERSGASLDATWSACSGATGYALTAWSGTSSVASLTTASTSGTLSVPSDLAPLTLTVAATGACSIGPTSAAVTVCAPGPSIASAVTDPISGLLTLSWTPAVPAILQVFANGTPYGTPITSKTGNATLPSALPAGISVTAAVALTSTAPTQTGSSGPSFAIETATTTIVSARYDGANLRAEWTPVPAADGYVATAIDPSSTPPVALKSVAASTTSVSFPLANASAAAYVVVQPTFGPSTGAPSVRCALNPPALFVVASPPLPMLVVPALTPTATPTTLPAPPQTIYLPSALGFTAASLPIAAPGTPSPFTLAANPGNEAYPYSLTFAGDACAFTASPFRPTLASALTAFLTQVEATGGASPRALVALQQIVARAMPQSFSESLFYNYGIRAGCNFADLRPGLILRVAFSAYDLVAGSVAPAYANGYSAGPTVDYEIADSTDSTGAWVLGFDAFLARLVTNGILRVPGPTGPSPSLPGPAYLSSGGAEIADLFAPGFAQPFLRLFFPQVLQSPDQPAVARTAAQFTIAAAGTYAAMQAADSPVPSSAVAMMAFRGRAVLKLCIRIWVDGRDVVVPVGTTVGNVLDTIARRPPLGISPVRGLTVRRSAAPAVVDPASTYSVNGDYEIRFDWMSPSPPPPSSDVFSLPLLHGDRVCVTS